MNEDTALAMAASASLPNPIQSYLFSCHPLNEKRFSGFAKDLIFSLVSNPPTSSEDFPSQRQNGWVEFISSDDILNLDSSLKKECIKLIETCELSTATVLATSKDFVGRIAIEVAIPVIKRALQERLLFLGCYELSTGAPTHKSATCVVIKAYDERAEEGLQN